MISLEELANINRLIATCNEMINGKFILADYKIASILKNITASQAVYQLLENCLNGYNFEKDFRTAELKTNGNLKKFTIPTEPEKVLPFVFCLLVSIKNKTLNFDAFLKEFYPSKNGRAEEYANFAKDIVLPFRNIIANYFDIPLEKAEQLTTEKEQPKEVNLFDRKPTEAVKEPKIEEKTESENLEDEWKEDEQLEQEKDQKEEKEEKQEEEITPEQVEQFLLEVKAIATEIVLELNADRRTKPEIKEDYIYIIKTLIYSCEEKNLRITLAFITAISHLLKDIKSTRFLTRELRRVLIDFYA